MRQHVEFPRLDGSFSPGTPVFVPAADMLAAMETQRETRGFERRPCEKAVIKRRRAEVRKAVEPARLEALWREGRNVTFEEAVAAIRH